MTFGSITGSMLPFALKRLGFDPYVPLLGSLEEHRAALANCRLRGREGIVSRKKHAPYKSGKCDWLTVKCGQWKEFKQNWAYLFAGR